MCNFSFNLRTPLGLAQRFRAKAKRQHSGRPLVGSDRRYYPAPEKSEERVENRRSLSVVVVVARASARAVRRPVGQLGQCHGLQGCKRPSPRLPARLRFGSSLSTKGPTPEASRLPTTAHSVRHAAATACGAFCRAWSVARSPESSRESTRGQRDLSGPKTIALDMFAGGVRGARLPRRFNLNFGVGASKKIPPPRKLCRDCTALASRGARRASAIRRTRSGEPQSRRSRSRWPTRWRARPRTSTPPPRKCFSTTVSNGLRKRRGCPGRRGFN